MAVGSLAARSLGPAQPPARSHKDPGKAVRSEAQQDFQGTLPCWLLLATIPAASVLRRAFKAELGLQVPLGEARRHKRLPSVWPSCPWNSTQLIAIGLRASNNPGKCSPHSARREKNRTQCCAFGKIIVMCKTLVSRKMP